MVSSILFVPEVDTIFEIGGQDSKYIFIRDGTLADFEMNKPGTIPSSQAKRAAILGLYLRPTQHAEELVGLQGRDNNVGSATGTVGQSALRGLKGSEEPPYPVLHRSRSFDVKITHLGAAPAFRRHEPRYE